MNSGQLLWKKAVGVIPGGNGLLSKRPDRYASEIWPTYFSKAKGCEIWDLDGNKYVDMAQNGIGTSILGYADEHVNAAVIKAINNAVNTTLNAPEEVYLAQKILKLHPLMGMVKFARGGGEAMSIAVRIARAFTRKDKVLFSGYHGWTDWYLSTNLQSKSNLDSHLLAGLEPLGVPSGLAGTAIPFKYNDISDFMEKMEKNPDVGVIVIEGARYDLPKKDFLERIQIEAKNKKVTIIVDEITSGWRMTPAGVYQSFDFDPDMVVYGKALGNGFAISAVVGKKDIMDASQDTFISSTMWTERVGFAAGIATLDKLSKYNVHKYLVKLGSYIGDEWSNIALKHGLMIEVTEYKPLISFKLKYKNNNEILTVFIQEMLKRGYLATSSVYVTYSHTKEVVDAYLFSVDEVFELISIAIKNNEISKILETSIRTDLFKRLN